MLSDDVKEIKADVNTGNLKFVDAYQRQNNADDLREKRTHKNSGVLNF